jgi:FkbM family methyltransferase
MSLKRNIVRLLDRPGGRRILGAVATRVARRQTGTDVTVFYDGLWTHRVGSYYFPDGRRFNYYGNDLASWRDQAQTYLTTARDYWMRHYRPAPGDVIIDVGAGQGEDVLAFAEAVGPTGKVIALEAFPGSCEILKRFCELNRLSNTTVLNVALMDKPGSVSMVESDTWSGNAVYFCDGAGGARVPAMTLDAVCAAQGVEQVAFLKMNIEGAERFALPGVEPMIDRVGTICVACHDFRADRGDGEEFRTRAFVERFLTEHGFRLARRPDDPRPSVRDHVFGLRS